MHSWCLKHHSTQPIYIFNRENPQNSESPNGPKRGLDFIALDFITLLHYCLHCNSLWWVTAIPDNVDMRLYLKDQNQCVHPNFCIHVTCNASISNVSFVAKWCHTTCCRAHKPAPSNKTCINSNLSNLILRCQIHWDKILNLNWKRKQSILLHFFALVLFLFYLYQNSAWTCWMQRKIVFSLLF